MLFFLLDKMSASCVNWTLKWFVLDEWILHERLNSFIWFRHWVWEGFEGVIQFINVSCSSTFSLRYICNIIPLKEASVIKWRLNKYVLYQIIKLSIFPFGKLLQLVNLYIIHSTLEYTYLGLTLHKHMIQ